MTDNDLRTIDRAIHIELERPDTMPFGTLDFDLAVPPYTTDLNVAFELIDSWFWSGDYDSFWLFPTDGTLSFVYTEGDSLALAICKSRFPHLFETKETAS